jgi:hypothetical protein
MYISHFGHASPYARPLTLREAFFPSRPLFDLAARTGWPEEPRI